MRSHIFVHRATTKYFSNSFVSKIKIEKEGLPGDVTPALGAGCPEFESRRPDQSFLKLTGISQKPFPALWGKFGGPLWDHPHSLLHFLHLHCTILL
jgi:hypothetical protein